MSRDIILPGGDTLELFPSVYTAEQVEALLSRLIPGGGIVTSDLADGTVTWPKLAVDAQPIRRNLLINSYFVGGGSQQGAGQFPINQRGKTEYIGNGYGLDGWMIVQGSGAKVALETDCIKLFLPANSVFAQYMDAKPVLIGQTLTYSALTDDNELFTFTSVFQSTGQSIFDFYYHEKHFQVRFTKYGTYFGFYIYSYNDDITKEIGIVAAKLEVGPNQTLAHKDAAGNWILNDPPPDFCLELLKCQRHQLFGNLSSLYASKYNSSYRVFIPTPTPLRAKPTIVGTPKAYSVANNTLLSGATVAIAYLCNNGVLCNVTGISEPCYLWFDPQDGLDANL